MAITRLNPKSPSIDGRTMSGEDLNDMVNGECWWGNNFSNAPDGMTNVYFSVFMIRSSQFAIGYRGSTELSYMYVRSHVNDAWQPWTRVDNFDVGAYYSTPWTASQSTGINARLTENIVLPAGVYVVCMMLPGLSTSTYAMGLKNHFGEWVNNQCTYVGASQTSKTVLLKLTSQTTMYLKSNQTASCYFSNKEYGGLTAVRIA